MRINFNELFEGYENSILEAKKELLISMLDKIGFIGIDFSIEESLFEYNLVSFDGKYLAHKNGNFEFFSMCRENIETALSYLKDDYYQYLGMSKEEINFLLDEGNYNQVVSDIFSYDNTVLINDYFSYPFGIDEVIESLRKSY